MIGEHQKTVREAGRDPEQFAVLGRQVRPAPAAEGERMAADVHHHVVHRARDHAHEFALRLADLVVQAEQVSKLQLGTRCGIR